MTKADALTAMYGEHPLVFGHRGASAYAPENTIPAFRKALEQKAHGIELDVQLTSDGIPVIMHDFSADKTTNGAGPVAEKSLDEIKSLDAGAWFSPEYAGTRIPTLAEVFEAVGNDLYINVELKTMSVEANGLEQAVADCIQASHMESRVLISSFNPMALVRFRKIAPEIPIGYLYAPGIPEFPKDVLAQLEHEAIHPYYGMINAAHIAKAREDNQYINTWTVNDPVDAIALIELGVDLIISDNPDVILSALTD